MAEEAPIIPQLELDEEGYDDWKPVVVAGIQAYNNNLELELHKLEVAKLEREHNYEITQKNLELAKHQFDQTMEFQKQQSNRNFILRLIAMVSLLGIAIGLMFVKGDLALGISLFSTITVLAMGGSSVLPLRRPSDQK